MNYKQNTVFSKTWRSENDGHELEGEHGQGRENPGMTISDNKVSLSRGTRELKCAFSLFFT